MQDSRFVVSLDSGTAHVAASLGVTCFCLTGVWDGHRVLPYVIDEMTSDTEEPICIYRKDVNIESLPCYGCFSKRHIGWGNTECNNRRKSELPCLCFESITVENVIEMIIQFVKVEN